MARLYSGNLGDPVYATPAGDLYSFGPGSSGELWVLRAFDGWVSNNFADAGVELGFAISGGANYPFYAESDGPQILGIHPPFQWRGRQILLPGDGTLNVVVYNPGTDTLTWSLSGYRLVP